MSSTPNGDDRSDSTSNSSDFAQLTEEFQEWLDEIPWSTWYFGHPERMKLTKVPLPQKFTPYFLVPVNPRYPEHSPTRKEIASKDGEDIIKIAPNHLRAKGFTLVRYPWILGTGYYGPIISFFWKRDSQDPRFFEHWYAEEE